MDLVMRRCTPPLHFRCVFRRDVVYGVLSSLLCSIVSDAGRVSNLTCRLQRDRAPLYFTQHALVRGGIGGLLDVRVSYTPQLACAYEASTDRWRVEREATTSGVARARRVVLLQKRLCVQLVSAVLYLRPILTFNVVFVVGLYVATAFSCRGLMLVKQTKRLCSTLRVDKFSPARSVSSSDADGGDSAPHGRRRDQDARACTSDTLAQVFRAGLLKPRRRLAEGMCISSCIMTCVLNPPCSCSSLDASSLCGR